MGKNKKIIFVAVLGIINLVFILVIFQIIKDIKENSQALISQKKELVLLENKIKDLEEFEKEYKVNKEELEKINKLFIEPENPVKLINFLNFLRKTATDSEMVINISPPSQKTPGDPWPSLTFQVSCRGKFIGIMKFLEKLENSPYLIEISNFSIKSTRREESEIEANLSLKVYSK